MTHQPPPGGPAFPYDAPPAAAPGPGYAAVPPMQAPATGVGWVIAGFLLFWPTGIPALFAFQRAERALGAGDWHTAATEGARAKKFGIISLCVFGGMTLIQVAFIGVWFAMVASIVGTGSWSY